MESAAVKMWASCTMKIFGRCVRCTLQMPSSPGALCLKDTIVLYTSIGVMGLVYGQLGSSRVKSAIGKDLHTSRGKLVSVSSVSGWMRDDGGGPMRVDHSLVMTSTCSADEVISALFLVWSLVSLCVGLVAL